MEHEQLATPSSREDPKMRRMKELLKSGPVLLQETKWRRNQEEILLQHISGLQLAASNAIRTGSDSASGGAAVLLPAGWVIIQRIVLLEGRAIAVLVSDRSKIVKLNVRVRPTVLNNPNDCLHETIPTDAFMPGKNGRIPKDNRSLQSLVRLLHRTHKRLFDGTLQTDGFRLDIVVLLILALLVPIRYPLSMLMIYRISYTT